MKKLILSLVALSTLSIGLVGCGFYRADDGLDKDAAISSNVKYYNGRVAFQRDVVVYRKDPKHVFVYNGMRYRIKHHNDQYVYYRVYF